MMRLVLVTLMSLTLGCAAAIPPPAVDGDFAPVAYRIELTVRSDLQDPYYVNRGPFGSYRSYPVNDWLQTELAKMARTKGTDGEVLSVDVRIESLKTDYEGIGGIQPLPSVLRRGEPPDLPERVIKTAVLSLAVEVSRTGKTLLDARLERRFVQELAYNNLDPLSRYRDDIVDYRPVLEGIVVEAVYAVDTAIDRAVR